ncbi:MAG TPA: alpha/beta fold hydrolase [Streptosporangiaceae bacterium]|nr:alpha/beta fold hydrolase [Streptosporangiaceae bacterium]
MSEIVLVHGAWHGPWCWDGVVAELRRLGLQATAVDLPFGGLDADAAAVRAAINTAGPGCVVVGHSYGGIVISEAAAGLPAVTRLIYLAAFLTEPDADTTALISEKLAGSIVVDERGITVDPAAAAEVFYGDADPDTAAAMAVRLRPMPMSAIEPSGTDPSGDEPAEARPPAWLTVPATYVVCTNDQAIPVEAQREMATRAEKVVEWPTSHTPFVTRPAEVAELIASYAS